MTALQVIESTLPLISGSTVSKEKNYDTLLTYLNFAKARIARDTNLWIGGETITLTEENVYTLSTIPLQITQAFDDNLRERPRNSYDSLGYLQLSPNTIHINNPEAGVNVSFNWFEEPIDYLIDDEVLIPSDLIEAMQFYIAFKVFNIYKSESEEVKKRLHLEQYKMIIEEYKFKTDVPKIDYVDGVDLISQKGLV